VNALLAQPSTDASETPRSSRRRGGLTVAIAVATVEGPRLLRHPATIIGAVGATALAVVNLASRVPVLHRDVLVLAVCAAVLALGVLTAAHLATSRLHRDELLPLSRIVPSTPAARICGHLLALAWPAGAAVLWCVLGLGALLAIGGGGRPALGDVLAPGATVLLGGALGVAAGRVAPRAIAAIVTLLLTVFGLGLAWSIVSVSHPTRARLLPWADWFPETGAQWVEQWPREPGLHLLYVVLLAAALGALALVRDRRDVAVLGGLTVSVVGVVLVAARLLDPWGDAERVAALVRDVQEPEHRLVCDATDDLEVCVVEGHDHFDPVLREQVLLAAATVPDDVAPLRVEMGGQLPAPLLVSVRDDASARASLPADVVERAERPFEAEGVRPPESGIVQVSALQGRGLSGGLQRLDLALGVIGQSTGVPLPARFDRDAGGALGPREGCPPDLAAVEVLTFALAAASHPGAREALRQALDDRPYGWVGPDGPMLFGSVAFDSEFNVPGGGTTTPVTTGMVVNLGAPADPWSRGAATLGLALSDAATPQQLWAAWDRWTDPATPTDELIEAFDLEPLPTPYELAVAAGIEGYVELDPRCA
jgi:hypothetical protein